MAPNETPYRPQLPTISKPSCQDRSVDTSQVPFPTLSIYILAIRPVAGLKILFHRDLNRASHWVPVYFCPPVQPFAMAGVYLQVLLTGTPLVFTQRQPRWEIGQASRGVPSSRAVKVYRGTRRGEHVPCRHPAWATGDRRRHPLGGRQRCDWGSHPSARVPGLIA